MADYELSESRTVLAHLLHSKNDGTMGFVRPLAEFDGDDLLPVTSSNFCQTGRIFITSGYEELENKYPLPRLFRLQVSQNANPSENVGPSATCRYIATYRAAEDLRKKELLEVIETDLPDANDRAITLSRLPGTDYIFVDDGKFVHGPLKWEVNRENLDQITISFIDANLPFVKLAPFQIYRIERNVFLPKVYEIGEGSEKRRFVRDLSIVQGAIYEDYSSDIEVVKFVAKQAQESNLKLIEKSRFESLVATLLKNPKLNQQVIRQRLIRMPEIVSAAASMQADLVEGMTTFLKGEQGRQIVTDYVEQHEDQLLDGLRKKHEAQIRLELDGLSEHIRQAEGRLKSLDVEKRELSLEVERKRSEASAAPDLRAEHEKMDAQLADKRKQIADLETKIAQVVAHDNALSKLDAIESRIKDSTNQYDYAVRIRLQLEATLEKQREEIGKSDEYLRQKLTNLKPFVDAINGTFIPDDKTPQPDIAVAIHPPQGGGDAQSQQRDIVAAVRAELAARGRPMDDWQAANLLISTQQSFITVFAGLPGVGKTSLARLLPAVQGSASRLQEIAVARGWTSQKDLIGYYNPLTSRFQPSGTGMYPFLRELDREKNASECAMAYALLDEANLSSIEHYWSCFMGMADDGGTRALALGDQVIAIPKHLRFLTTINYDGTTEPLSPRITDRACVILLEPQGYSAPEEVTSKLKAALPVSAEVMQRLFGREAVAPDLSDAERGVFNKIRSVLLDNDTQLGRSLSISPRKELAIRHFCHKARGIMAADNDGLLALDLAVMQHVLPQVQGTGVRFAKRLDKLRRELDTSGMSTSARFVNRMIEHGVEELHNYDFFCW